MVTTTINPEKRYTLSDVFDGKRIQSASLSPNGKFIIVSYQETYPGGKQSSFTQILDKATGSVLVENGQSLRWMPKSNLAYYTRKMKGTELVTLDPTSKKENILACQLPEVLSVSDLPRTIYYSPYGRKDRKNEKRSKRYWCRMIANRDGETVCLIHNMTCEPDCSNGSPMDILLLTSTIYLKTATICYSVAGNRI